MAPVERALNAGRLSEVELIVGGREHASRFDVQRSSFARRWRARLSPPRLSHLLAASFIDTGVAPEMAIDPFGRA